MRWRILLVLMLARIALGLQFQVVGSTGEYLRPAFSLDYTRIGTLIGLYTLPGLFLAIPFGMAGKWFSDRALSCTGFALIALGGVLAALASSAEIIGVGRVISGAGFVMAALYLTKMTTDWFSGREIATAMSILVMTWPLGIAIGQTVHEWLAAAGGWRLPFWVASAYADIAVLVVLLLYREPPRAATGAGAAVPAGMSTAELVLTPLAASVWALFNAGYIVFLSFAPHLLVDRGFTEISAAATISVASYLMMFSGAGGGILADRTGKPDWVTYGCTTVAIVSLLMLANPALALTGSVLFGLIGVAPAGVIMSLAAQAMHPQNRAFCMGIFLSVSFFAMAVAPAIAGWVFDATGDPQRVVWFAASLFLGGMLANALFRYAQRRFNWHHQPAQT